MRLAARGNEISVVGEGDAENIVRHLLAGFSELLTIGETAKRSGVAASAIRSRAATSRPPFAS